MIRLNSEGAPLWSYCTAKDGPKQMAPLCAHENGQISAVLTSRRGSQAGMADRQRRGRLARRRTAPAIEAGLRARRNGHDRMPYDRDGAPHLALIVGTGDALRRGSGRGRRVFTPKRRGSPKEQGALRRAWMAAGRRLGGLRRQGWPG